MNSVPSSQRFTKNNPCPVCGGGNNDPHGQGRRCWGFLASDGAYAHCSREEYANGIEQTSESNTYAHRLGAQCKCGQVHGSAPVQSQAQSAVTSSKADIQARYEYQDADGFPRHRTVRRTDKTWWQERRDGDAWESGLDGIEKVLYRLPELRKADESDPVFLTEGEKDADRLAEMGLVATTCAGGAPAWEEYYSVYLFNRHVVIFADNDEDGTKAAYRRARALEGAAASIKVIEFPQLPKGGDVSDFLDQGCTKEQLLRMVADSPEWSSIVESQDDQPTVAGSRFRFLSRDDLVNTQPQDWTVRDILLQESVAVLFGPPAAGKTFLSLSWSLSVAAGCDWLGRETTSGPVVYITVEGRRGMGKRLLAWEQENNLWVPEQFKVVHDSLRLTADGDVNDLLRDLGRLPMAPALIVVDTLARFFGYGDENSTRDMNAFFAGVRRIQMETAATVLVLHHPRKDGTAFRGSSSLEGDVDTLLSLREKQGLLALGCDKQRDEEAGWSVGLERSTIALPDGRTSCVIRPSDVLPSDDDDTLHDDQVTMLVTLSRSEPGGLTASDWLKTTAVAESTFYRHLKKLVEASYVHLEAPGRGAKYHITEKGREEIGTA